MTAYLRNILAQFRVEGTLIDAMPYGSGHINKTYLVKTDKGVRYILQQVNETVFRDIDGLMFNISAVTTHLLNKAANPRGVLLGIKTCQDELYLRYEGKPWRVYEFVEDAVCLDRPETPEDLYQSGVAFGNFQQQLLDFPAHTLVETIPNFHNTRDRYRIFREVLAADPMGRAKEVSKEIDFVLAREEEAGILVELLEEGKLPLRVTHNDTKLNNVLLDKFTRKPLCVIDLDTVMPGLSLYDYGDSIRFGAATGQEDDKDLSGVQMSLALFETYTKGFLSACPGLTPMELELLPTGAKIMTLECGVRFLTDYLDGDRYFANRRPGQNLDRSRTQFRLVEDMESKWDAMAKIIEGVK